MECVVYWLRLSEHKDPSKDGYIGVSTDYANRLKAHKKNPDNETVRKFSNSDEMISEVLFHGTVEECLRKEYEFRPSYRIGWNIIPGGGLPPKIKDIDVNGDIARKISSTLKKRNTNPYSEKTHSEEANRKRKETIQRNQKKWFFDPVNNKCVVVNTGIGETPKEGWFPGKKNPETLSREYRIKLGLEEKKIAGVDYGNIANWVITDPDGNVYNVRSLKQWCRDNNHKYSTVVGSYNGWKAEKQR
jgi:predicted GIY-YIG superfamily endonuclease